MSLVRKALIAPHAHPGRLRWGLALLVLAGLVLGATIWAPSALTQKTLSVVHHGKRAEIGAAILGHVQRQTGPSCRDPAGTAALAKLHQRLIGSGSAGQLVVVRDLPKGAAALPGGITLVDRRLIEQHDDPAIASGYILAAVTGDAARDPLALLLDHAGLQTTMSLFTTGEVQTGVLAAYAEYIREPDQMNPTPEALRAAFDAAAVPAAPYLIASGASAEMRAAFEGLSQTTARPVMKDSDWVTLQGICGT